MEGVQIDGNNILTVYDTIKGVREYCIREQKPYLIECMTFRMRGHEEAAEQNMYRRSCLNNGQQKIR
jgi:2-oxoisovalerate dehydrogenase E1 component